MNTHWPAPAKLLEDRRQALHERASAGDVGIYPERSAHIVDLYFQERLADFRKLTEVLQRSSFALVAVGGYGRSELCPASDVDVLLLFDKTIPDLAEELSSWLFHPLWDLGFELGHGVRTFADCFDLARADFQVLASLLDLRFVAGDERVVTRFQALYLKKVLTRKRTEFATWLAETNAEREASFGDSSGLLEPDLKNGTGGLRGVHQIGWCGQVLASDKKWTDPLTAEERATLEEDYRFLLRTRTALHLTARRHSDVLRFGHQPAVAGLLGYMDQDASPREKGMAVERFLSDLHTAMVRVKSLRAAYWQECFPPRWQRTRRIGPGISDTPRGLDLDGSASGSQVLELFHQVAETGRPLSLAATRTIRTVLDSGGLAPSASALEALLSAVRGPHGLQAVRLMQETGVLAALLPAMQTVEHLIQFDDYHVHPVGRHTVETVGRVAALVGGEDERFGSIAAGLEHPDSVLLAALFHDLGKGSPDHSAAGAELAEATLSGFGYAPGVVENVSFLVRYHLLIPKTATRKDLADERVAACVAEKAETKDRLDMLYLLSVADSMATGPRAWSEWTAALMRELYSKTRSLLLYGPLSVPDVAKKARQTRLAVLEQAEQKDREYVTRCLERMPPRAFQALSVEDILRHMDIAAELEERLKEDAVRSPARIRGLGVSVVRHRKTGVGNTYEVTIAAKDRPGLFATFAGIFVLHKLTILAADLFTWKDGTVVDVFVVEAPVDQLYPDEVFERVQRAIHYAFLGKLSLGYRLDEMRRSPLHVSERGPDLPPVIAIDNEASKFHTRIEVAAPDRLGLLYDIASALADMYLDIHLAKITTDAGRIADVFYVLDSEGRKLNHPGLRAQVEEELGKAVAK